MFRKHISTWAVLLLILVALGAVAVAGCGGSSSPPSPDAAVSIQTVGEDLDERTPRELKSDYQLPAQFDDREGRVRGGPGEARRRRAEAREGGQRGGL